MINKYSCIKATSLSSYVIAATQHLHCRYPLIIVGFHSSPERVPATALTIYSVPPDFLSLTARLKGKGLQAWSARQENRGLR